MFKGQALLQLKQKPCHMSPPPLPDYNLLIQSNFLTSVIAFEMEVIKKK